MQLYEKEIEEMMNTRFGIKDGGERQGNENKKETCNRMYVVYKVLAFVLGDQFPGAYYSVF